MDDRTVAHMAASAAFRGYASQNSESREIQPRHGRLRAASYDQSSPANMQSRDDPSNNQKSEPSDKHVSGTTVHRAVMRRTKTVEDPRMKTNALQKLGPPPVPPKISLEKKDDYPRASLPADKEEKDESELDDDAFDPTDLFFAVMGVTGAGKSTFISSLSEDAAEVGHDLQSKTEHVSGHRFQCSDGRRAWLIDTPGFDDTGRPNVEILAEIIASFTKLYERGGCISGIVYLHRITDPRMSGSAKKALEIFKLLIGASAMPIIRLVSTRWNEVDLMGPDLEKAERLEDQLRTTDRYWAEMIRDGAIALRHFGTRASAQAVISTLIEERESAPKLAIVREILDEKLPLLDTATGRFVSHDSDELRKQYEAEIQQLQQERKQALEGKDHEAAESLAIEERKYQERKEDLLSTRSQFNANFQRLHNWTYQRPEMGDERFTSEESSEGLRSENELLHLEREHLEEKIVKTERQHRIDRARLEAAIAQQGAQEREKNERHMNEISRSYEYELRQMKNEHYRLKKKYKKLKRGSPNWFEWLFPG